MAISKEPLFTKSTTVIFVCTMIIRVLTIGYVIGGLIMRFELFYLEYDVVKVLDLIPLGHLPFGSTLMFLVYSLMPFLLLYSIVGGISLMIIVRRSKMLLLSHAVGHSTLIVIEIVYLSLISWIVHESADNSTMTKGFERAHEYDRISEWKTLFEKLSCCNVRKPETTIAYWFEFQRYLCSYTTGCLDKIRHLTSTYGGYYIAVISANIVTSVVCLAITDYYFRVAELSQKKERTRNELYKCKNGILGQLCIKSSIIWKRNKLVWISVFLKSVDLVYEVSLGASVIVFSYSWLRDYDLKDTMYGVWKDGISMGYLESVLSYSFLCVLAISMGLKFLNFAAIHRKSGTFMIAYIIAEFFLLLVEITIFIFLTLILRMLYSCKTGIYRYYIYIPSFATSINKLCDSTLDNWYKAARNNWLAFGFLLLHIVIKISHLAMADRLFKSIYTRNEEQAVGFLHFLLLKIKRKPLIAVSIGVGVFTMVFSAVFLCGLLVVRYDQYAYTRITSTLHGISYSMENIGDIRDTSYILMIVTLILTALLQIVFFVGVYFEKSYLLTSTFGFQIFLLIPHIISLFMIVVPLKLIYCCIEGVEQCDFSSNRDDLKFLCSGQTDLWISTTREIWLFWSFTLASFFLQLFSLVLCWKLYRKLFSEAICVRQCKRIYTGVINNHIKFISSLTLCTLVIEIGFGIAIYAYFFENIYPTSMQQLLGRLTYLSLDMQYLMNGLTYTLLTAIPISVICRPLFLWLILYKGKLQASFGFVIGYLINIFGELTMLILSSILLNWINTCQQQETTLYMGIIPPWVEFCNCCKGVIQNMEAIKITFLACHLVLNTIYVILVDRIYPFLNKDEENRGVLKILWVKLKTKLQSAFRAVQLFGIAVDVSYCIAVYTLYFVNFYPFDQRVQQDLGSFKKHRYDMQDLLNAVAFTLMSIIPLTLLFRSAILYHRLHTRSSFIYVIITILFVFLGGYIVLLTQSSYLLDLAYSCIDRSYSYYSSWKFTLFCDTLTVNFVFDITAVFVSYLVLQILLNVLSMFMLDQLYSYLGETGTSKGAVRSACERLYISLKPSKMKITFFVVFWLMLILRLLFWIGLILMGLSPGYIHTGLIDILHSMHIGNLNYGTMSMGLMYSHMALVPVDIACHGLELFALTRMSKTFLIITILMRIVWIGSDVTTLTLSSTILYMSYCLCGPGPVCLSSLYYKFKSEVCRDSYLLFHASGTLVAYLAVNVCSHIFELTVCFIMSKKTSTKISPSENQFNGERGQEESLEIESFGGGS